MADEINNDDLVAMTADVVSAYLTNNKIATDDVAALIASVHAALSGAASPVAAEPAVKQEPAVSVRSSIKHDYIVCLEDGAKLKMLKRYLRTNFDMSPEDYRTKWGLPRDYPMVAPAYAEQRRTLAHQIGLGRRKESAAPAPKAEKAPAKPRGRPRKTPEQAEA